MVTRFRSRRRGQNKIAMALVTTVLMMLIVVVAYNSIQLREKRTYYIAKEIELEEKLALEEARVIEIEEYEKYTQTKKYIEEVAKDKFGLVYDGEIIFKESN